MELLRKKIGSVLLVLLVLSGCEDVVQIDTPSEEPRLIVDAILRVDTSQPTINVRVKVSLTSSFFGTIPLTDLQQITLTNLDMPTNMGENILILKEKNQDSGVYEELTSTEFVTNGRLVLQVGHNDRLYYAETQFVPTVPINSISQGDGTLFSEDDTEIIISFTDKAETRDYYLFDFDFNEFLVTEDQFYQGQLFEFSYFYNVRLGTGQVATISIMGADKNFYNYMGRIIEQSGEVFGPFATPAATVRGNIFDVTDLDNNNVLDNVEQPNIFPLGYFAVVETFTENILID